MNNSATNNVKDKFVGKSEEVFLTQFAFDLKIEELKTASNPDNQEKKFTVHGYGNDRVQLVKDCKAILDQARKEIK